MRPDNRLKMISFALLLIVTMAVFAAGFLKQTAGSFSAKAVSSRRHNEFTVNLDSSQIDTKYFI